MKTNVKRTVALVLGGGFGLFVLLGVLGQFVGDNTQAEPEPAKLSGEFAKVNYKHGPNGEALEKADDYGKLDKEYRRITNGFVFKDKSSGEWKLHGMIRGYYVPADSVEQILVSEQYWFNDELHGPFRQWYVNGTPKSEGGYANGKMHGVRTDWNIDGTKLSEVVYDHGQEVKTVFLARPSVGRMDEGGPAMPDTDRTTANLKISDFKDQIQTISESGRFVPNVPIVSQCEADRWFLQFGRPTAQQDDPEGYSQSYLWLYRCRDGDVWFKVGYVPTKNLIQAEEQID